MSLTLLLPILLAGEPAKPAAAATDDPPLRIWINNDGRFLRGDRARVHVWAEDDGYLVVLQADTEGHLKVLFPIDPTDDNFLRGGKKYEVKSRGGRDAFDVGDHTGRGTVYAAVSRTPFRFTDFVLSDHWDYRALEAQQLPEDPESDLTELVRRMAQGSFDYDVMSYYVVESVVYAGDSYYYGPSVGLSYGYGGFGCGYYGSCGSGFSVSLAFGAPFYPRPYYFPYYPYYYAYTPYYPFFYDPYYYRPYYYSSYYYRPYYYGRYGYGRYGGYPYRYRYPAHHDYYGNRPYSPYRFRGGSLANTDFRDRRYTFGRAVNTVYTPPRTRFTEPETSSPLRRTLNHEDGAQAEPALRRRASGTSVADRAEPRAEPRRATERRTEAGTIEARRARPAESPRASETRGRREAMPVDVTPRRSGSENSDGRTAERPTVLSTIEARRARPAESPRASDSRSGREAMPVDVTARRSSSYDSDERTARRSGDEGATRATRAEPRSEPRSAPRSEPRAEPRSSGGGDRGGWSGGGWSGGDGGRGGGSWAGGGGVSSSGGGRRR